MKSFHGKYIQTYEVGNIERSKIQKEKILRNAFHLFKAKGFIGTTTREIAKESQIRSGLLHYYYKQKEDILFHMYNDLITGMHIYLTDVKQTCVSGLAHIALFNLFYYKVLSDHQYMNTILFEILSSRSLRTIKINNTLMLYQKAYQELQIPVPTEKLFLSTAIAIGAESELLLNIIEGNLSMSHEELAHIINRLEFSMLDVPEDEVSKVMDVAKRASEELQVAEFIDYFKSNYPWSN